MNDVSPICLRVLGGLELRDGDGAQVDSILSQPKRLALLIYLAASPGRSFHSRQSLFGLFWPELDEIRARAALSQALYVLKSALGEGVIVRRGREEVGVDPGRVECDAARFEADIAAEHFEAALKRYEGDLLEGHHLVSAVEWEEWLEFRRTHLRALAADAAWALAEADEAQGRIAEAIQWGQRALSLSDDDELVFRKLLELLDRSGDKAAAIRLYRDYADRVARDYDVEVSSETRALLDRIRAEDPTTETDAAPASAGRGRDRRNPGFPANPPTRRFSRSVIATLGLALAGVPVVAGWLSYYQPGLVPAVGLRGDSIQIPDVAAPGPGVTTPIQEQARDLHERGRHMLARGDAEAYRQARDLFQRALELDPGQGLAWSGLSEAYERLAWSRVLSPSVAYPRAREAAERALEIDPDLAEAHAALGMAFTRYFWDSGLATRHFERALALDPDNADFHRRYAAHLRLQGHLAKSRELSTKALELDPLAFFSHFELLVLGIAERRFDDVIRSSDELLSVHPGNPMVTFIKARALAGKEEYQSALEILEQMGDAGERRPALTLRGFIQGRTQREQEALEVIDRLESLGGREGLAPIAFDKAVIQLGMGRYDEALASLDDAIAQRDDRARLLGVDPMFDELRDAPRFSRLLKQAGLPPQ